MRLLRGANFQLDEVTSIINALALIGSFNPHVVFSYLNFGVGLNRANFLLFVENDHP